MIIDLSITNIQSINAYNILEKRFNKIHNNKYNYDKAVYKGTLENIVITCSMHKDFKQKPSEHLRGAGCPQCANKQRAAKKRVTKEEFIRKVKEQYLKYNYDYSKMSFNSATNTKQKVKVVCPDHGSFMAIAGNHMIGKSKCPECALRDKHIASRAYTSWEKAGKASKNFVGFSIYIIECWNEDERFIKIGKTFVGVSKRYNNKCTMPYEFKVIKSVEGSAGYISKLETQLHKDFKDHRYKPLKKFNGRHECKTLEVIKLLPEF